MAGPTTSNIEASQPLPKHALSFQYLRLRILAFFLQVPLTTLLTFTYYFYDPWLLRKHNVTRNRILVPSRQMGRAIKVDVYEPRGGVVKRPSPVIVNWHGSGFVLPCFGADAEQCCKMASTLGCVVLDADYRKAPQNPFPAAPQDAEDICLYVHANPKQFDTSRITLTGYSAGACIALAVGARMGPERIHSIACVAPPTDFTWPNRIKRAERPGEGFAMPRWARRAVDQSYLIANGDRTDPLLSPICADACSFPKTTYIACGTGDNLYRDGRRLIDKLQEAGHPSAIFRAVKGVGHGFEHWGTNDPGSKSNWVMNDMISVIRTAWQQTIPRSRASKM